VWLLPALVLALLDPIRLPDCASCMMLSLILASLSLRTFTSMPFITVTVEPSEVEGMIDVLYPEHKRSPVVLALNDVNGSEEPEPVNVLYVDVSRFHDISVAPVFCVDLVGFRNSVYAIHQYLFLPASLEPGGLWT